MPFLVAAIAVVAALCLLNLLLTFGVIRKLRAQAGQSVRDAQAEIDDALPAAGTHVPDFTGVDTAGAAVRREELGETLFGFFSPDCSACYRQLPLFVDAARASTRSVLAVLHGTPEETREQAAALAGVGRLVVEPENGPIGTALNIQAYPTLGVIDADGTLVTATVDTRMLPEENAAAGAARYAHVHAHG